MNIDRFSKFLTQILPKNVKKKSFPKLRCKQKNVFLFGFSFSCFFHYICAREGITVGINSGEQNEELTETKIIATAKDKQSQTKMKKTSKIHCLFFFAISL